MGWVIHNRFITSDVLTALLLGVLSLGSLIFAISNWRKTAPAWVKSLEPSRLCRDAESSARPVNVSRGRSMPAGKLGATWGLGRGTRADRVVAILSERA